MRLAISINFQANCNISLARVGRQPQLRNWYSTIKHLFIYQRMEYGMGDIEATKFSGISFVPVAPGVGRLTVSHLENVKGMRVRVPPDPVAGETKVAGE